jgi:hypothetical protein
MLWMTMKVLHGGDQLLAQPEHSNVCEVFTNLLSSETVSYKQIFWNMTPQFILFD